MKGNWRPFLDLFMYIYIISHTIYANPIEVPTTYICLKGYTRCASCMPCPSREELHSLNVNGCSQAFTDCDWLCKFYKNFPEQVDEYLKSFRPDESNDCYFISNTSNVGELYPTDISEINTLSELTTGDSSSLPGEIEITLPKQIVTRPYIGNTATSRKVTRQNTEPRHSTANPDIPMIRSTLKIKMKDEGNKRSHIALGIVIALLACVIVCVIPLLYHKHKQMKTLGLKKNNSESHLLEGSTKDFKSISPPKQSQAEFNARDMTTDITLMRKATSDSAISYYNNKKIQKYNSQIQISPQLQQSREDQIQINGYRRKVSPHGYKCSPESVISAEPSEKTPFLETTHRDNHETQSYKSHRKAKAAYNVSEGIEMQAFRTGTENADEFAENCRYQQRASEFQQNGNAVESNDISHNVNEYIEKYNRILESRPGEELSITFHTEDFAMATFNNLGGYLHIRSKSVSLFIPPGAIKERNQQRIYMYLDDGRYPDCIGSTTRLAPVVNCGPDGLHFSKSLILSFPTYAIRMDNWKFQAFSTQQSGASSKDWEEGNIVGHNVNDGTVYVMLDHFSKETVGATASTGEEKALKLGIFTKPHFDGEQFNFFTVLFEVYREKGVLDEAEKADFRMLNYGNKLLVINQKNDLHIVVDKVKNGWKVRSDDNKRIFSPHDIWKRGESEKCDFDLDREQPSDNKNGVHCKVSAMQKVGVDKNDNPEVYVSVNMSQGTWPEEKKSEDKTQITPQRAIGQALFGLVEKTEIGQLSEEAFYGLCKLLSVKNPVDCRDWRLLLEDLRANDVQTVMNFEQTKENPAAILIKIYFTVFGVRAIDKLRSLFKKHQLQEALQILNNDVAAAGACGSSFENNGDTVAEIHKPEVAMPDKCSGNPLSLI